MRIANVQKSRLHPKMLVENSKKCLFCQARLKKQLWSTIYEEMNIKKHIITMRRNNYDPQVTIVKKHNAEVFRETTSFIKAGYYTTPTGKRIDLDMQPMIDGSRCYHKDLGTVDAPKVEGGTTVRVEKDDCLKVAERMVTAGYNPALLNFASATHPGGGVEGGARAQEETICRRSTLSRSLFSFEATHANRYGYELHEGNNYPLTRSLDFSAIYSPQVTVFREAGPDYTLMESPFQVGVITNAALNMNGSYPIRLTPDGHIPEEGKAITRNKIRTILRIGLIKSHDSMVLGAFGCGAFKTPPREMAQLFKEVMAEEEFKDRYRVISFAILSDHNDRSGNLAAFEEVFGMKEQPHAENDNHDDEERKRRAFKNALSNMYLFEEGLWQ